MQFTQIRGKVQTPFGTSRGIGPTSRKLNFRLALCIMLMLWHVYHNRGARLKQAFNKLSTTSKRVAGIVLGGYLGGSVVSTTTSTTVPLQSPHCETLIGLVFSSLFGAGPVRFGRTERGLARSPDFKSGAINHSATAPHLIGTGGGAGS